MRYALFSFTKNIRGPQLPLQVCEDTCDRDTQCVVLQAVSAESERYLGTDWQCHHCIPPKSCTVCNPAYRDAILEACSSCTAGSKSWHLNDVCLHCNPEYQGIDARNDYNIMLGLEQDRIVGLSPKQRTGDLS